MNTTFFILVGLTAVLGFSVSWFFQKKWGLLEPLDDPALAQRQRSASTALSTAVLMGGLFFVRGLWLGIRVLQSKAPQGEVWVESLLLTLVALIAVVQAKKCKRLLL